MGLHLRKIYRKPQRKSSQTKRKGDNMKRDLSKAIAEYEQRFSHTEKGSFYASDFTQILELTVNDYREPYTITEGDGEGRRFYSLYTSGHMVEAISKALNAGFMIGYRTAQRHSRKEGTK